MTPFTLHSLSDLTTLEADTIIDVRSPSEFAEDHLPGAINLPVLDDAERARVGTIYKQDSPFNARKIGGALVAQNTAHHLETALADKDGSWQTLVYCWRGGQRSGVLLGLGAYVIARRQTGPPDPFARRQRDGQKVQHIDQLALGVELGQNHVDRGTCRRLEPGGQLRPRFGQQLGRRIAGNFDHVLETVVAHLRLS